MDTDQRVVFQVEIDPAADPIAGYIRLGEQELSFAGWVGFAIALELILEKSRR